MIDPQIFIQAFLTRILPLKHEVLLNAIRYFHMEQYPLNAVVAALGALTASAFLYLLGMWMRRLPEIGSTPEQQAKVERAAPIARQWLPWLLVLAPLPIGVVVIIVAGFFRVPPRVAAFSLVLAEIVFRLMPYR